jgi:hypothetical protein
MMSTNWTKIKLLEGRLAWHRDKYAKRTRKMAQWVITRNRAVYWMAKNEQRNNWKAVALNKSQIKESNKEIAKWNALVHEEVIEIVALKAAIIKLKPKGHWYPMGGWVSYADAFRMQRIDQGQDAEIPRYHNIIAPGNGHCVMYASDRPFPNGFGNPYVIVKITSGRFAGQDWYLGHANEPIIRPGQHFVTGQPLARCNNSLSSGWGWMEIGHWPPGSMSEGQRWHHLFAPLWR